MTDEMEGGQTTWADSEEPATEEESWSTDEGSAEEGAESTDEGGTEREDDSGVFEIDGKTYTKDDLRNFIKGGLLERDYRLKTAKLAEERRQIEELRQAAEAWQTINQYPEVMAALGDAIAKLLQGADAGADSGLSQYDVSSEDQPWKSELTRLQKEFQNAIGTYENRLREHNAYLWQQYYAGREAYAKSQLPKLMEKYPYLYEDEVVSAFRDNQDADLELLAKYSHEHWHKFASERGRANMEKRRQNAQARIATGPRGGGPSIMTRKPEDWDSARRSALERLRKVGQLFGGG